MKILLTVLGVLVATYAYAQACLVRVPNGGVEDRGPPAHKVIAHVQIWEADGGGKMMTLKDGGQELGPLYTYALEVDPQWTAAQKLEQTERLCRLYREQEARQQAASAFCDSMDGGWQKVVTP